METTADIISDEEIDRVHGNANFGSDSKRYIVDHGVLTYALGYSTGFTLKSILVEHGLIRKPRPMSYHSVLTSKGKRYLRAMVGWKNMDDIQKVLPGAAKR